MERGPFEVGARVRIPSRDSDGEVTAVGEPQTIRAYSAGSQEEIKQITPYTVRLDTGYEVNVADRDDHILPL